MVAEWNPYIHVEKGDHLKDMWQYTSLFFSFFYQGHLLSLLKKKQKKNQCQLNT